MNISSVIVFGRTSASESVRANLIALAGVEVHASTPDGRHVVTMEADDTGAATRTFEAIEQTPGVLSVALVYQRTEPNPERNI